MIQPDLLSSSPIARNTDPVTSHEAAETVTKDGTRASQQREVLTLVRAWPGRTSAKLATLSCLNRYEVARRLPELRAAGLVRNGEPVKCSVTGKRAMTWHAV